MFSFLYLFLFLESLTVSSLKLRILLPWCMECWDYRYVPPCPCSVLTIFLFLLLISAASVIISPFSFNLLYYFLVSISFISALLFPFFQLLKIYGLLFPCGHRHVRTHINKCVSTSLIYALNFISILIPFYLRN